MSNAVEVRAPAEQTEGTRSQILRWLKAVGENVAENEPLIEIETDKVTVEVASPRSGVLREILKQEQEEIAPGEILGRIEAPTEAARAVSSVDEAVPPARTPTGQPASPLAVGAASPASAAHLLSPAVRRLLAEHGLEASVIKGTGQGGRITVEDVLSQAMLAKGRAASETNIGAIAKAEAGTSTPEKASDITGPSHRVPHSAVRKRVAEHMVESLLHSAPHVTTVFDLNLTAVLDHRQRNREKFAQRGVPLTLTAYFLLACVDAIRAVPEANSRWRESELEIFESIHIGVATALDTGLVVPVLRDVQARDLLGIAQGLDDLVRRAREGRLSPSDVRGGTFTISNHGVSGSLVATPIVINQPQAAILGVGKLEKRPVVVEGEGEDQVVVQPKCYVTLTIDHRVMDGHQANRFLQTFVQRLETSLPE